MTTRPQLNRERLVAPVKSAKDVVDAPGIPAEKRLGRRVDEELCACPFIYFLYCGRAECVT